MNVEQRGTTGGQVALESAPCDLCGAEEAIEMYASSLPPRDTPPGDLYSSSRRKGTHGRVVRCQSCGLIRTTPRDTPQTLTTVYGALYDPDYEMETASRSATARRYVAFVERFTRPPGRLLDVGCSTGIFMAAARAHGWDVHGIEASAWAVDRARETFNLESVQQTTVEKAFLEQSSCDVVTLWDVLEHVASPTEVLGRVHNWLRPGGFVFLNVPNIESRTARLLRKRWPLLLREHLWYFSPATLESLLKKTGYASLDVKTNYVDFSAANVLIRLSQYGGPTRLVRRCLAGRGPLRMIRIRFPIGEINVAARRE